MDGDTRAQILEIIAVELQISPDQIRSGVSLRQELGMDSVAALNILFAAEEMFGIRVSETELEHVDDIDAVLKLVEQHLPTADSDTGKG